MTRLLAELAAARNDVGPEPGGEACLRSLLLDTAACSIAAHGAASGIAGVLRAADLASSDGTPEVPALLGPLTGHGRRQSAFVNGALAHALNYDAYGKARGPAGTVVVPAALAVCAPDTTGASLLRALAVGVEIGNRLGAATQVAGNSQTSSAETGMLHMSTGIEGQLLGTFAAAATAGAVLGLSVDAMHSALGLALMQAAGSAQVMLDGDVPAKGFYGGFAATAGVSAALAARAGVDARCAAIEGPAGLIGRFFPDGDPVRALDAVGDDPTRDILFKRWPCSSAVAPSLGAALDLHARVPVDAIERVVVNVPESVRPWCEPVADRRHPTNSACATNSIPYAVAVALVEGDFAPWHVGPGPAALSQVSELAARVEVTFRLDGDRSVHAELSDGTSFSASAPASQHLDANEVHAKLRRIGRWAGVEGAAEDLIDVVESLAVQRDLCALGPALRGLAMPSSPTDPGAGGAASPMTT